MKFGTSKANETETANSNGRYIKSFRDPETNLRFLDELDTWFVYYEHWDQGKQRSFPCTRDRNSCPGCTSENERTSSAAKRYLTNAVREYKGKEYTDLFKIPVSLMEALQRRFDKDGGTLLARNYTIAKSGKGTDTKYILEWDEKTTVNTEKYQGDKQDFEEALMAAYEEVWGPQDSEPAKPAVTVAKPAVAKAKAESKTEDSGPPWAADPPSEPEASAEQDDAEDDEDEVISEDSLRAMGVPELKALYERCGIAVPEGNLAPKELADHLITQLS